MPCPVVVRSSVESWTTTTSPSRVWWTSSSTRSTPSPIAPGKPVRLFSGQRRAPPRWAAIAGPPAPAAAAEVGPISASPASSVAAPACHPPPRHRSRVRPRLVLDQLLDVPTEIVLQPHEVTDPGAVPVGDEPSGPAPAFDPQNVEAPRDGVDRLDSFRDFPGVRVPAVVPSVGVLEVLIPRRPELERPHEERGRWLVARRRPVRKMLLNEVEL